MFGTSILPADWGIQIRESSLLYEQFLSICHDHGVNREWDFCDYKGKRQGRLGRTWVWVQVWGNSLVPWAQAFCSAARWLSSAGGEAFEVTDLQ